MSEGEPRGPSSPLAWAIVATSAALATWIAFRPLPESLPRAATPLPVPEAPEAGAVAPAPAEPPAVTPGVAPRGDAATELPPELPEPADPGTTETSALSGSSPEAELAATIARQLTMNDLAGIRVEVHGDRVVTSGALASAHDRMRLTLIVESLAPDYRHEDRTAIGPAPPRGGALPIR